jgi:multicomponent Na+:H+ antiporter subunit G
MTAIEPYLPWISNTLMLLGAFFVLTGALGILRMPDFFSRLHPAGVTDSVGVILVLGGLMVQAGLSMVSGKLLLLMLFLLLTSPTACHALAKAAYLSGMAKKKHDDPRAGEEDA